MAVTFYGRVGYGFDLEWMEGGMLAHAHRVMNGQPLYVVPSSDFIPFIYPPVFHWLLGGLGAVFGLDYAVGRSLSMAGTVLAALAVSKVAIDLKAPKWLLLAGPALFISTFDETGGFFDLVRLDGVWLGLLSWSLVLLPAGFVTSSALLLAVAFATKQTAAIFGFPMVWWLWRTHGTPSALKFTMWSACPALLFVALMLFEGDGLFLTYLLSVPATHAFVLGRFFPGAFWRCGGRCP